MSMATGSYGTSLNKQEKLGLTRKLGNMASSLSTTVVKLYTCNPGDTCWTDSGVWGITSVLIDRTPPKAYFIRIFDIKSFECLFSWELYEGMDYKKMGPQFHAFEINNGCVALSFCNAGEADTFHARVTANMPKSSGGAPSMTKSKASGWMATMKKTARKVIGKPATAVEIGRPTNFQHKQHIGYDPSKGFEMADIPDQWKQMFKSAGIKKKDLQNPARAAVIYETLQDQLGDDFLTQMGEDGPPAAGPPVPSRGPPGGPPVRNGPPVPPKRGAPGPRRGGPPTRGPPMPSRSAPPPVPAGPASSAPVAPPVDAPPPIAAPPSFVVGAPPAKQAKAKPRASLLDEISAGKKLKKTVKVEEEDGALPELSDQKANTLADMLKRSMKNRFEAMAGETVDDGSDDDWD